MNPFQIASVNARPARRLLRRPFVTALGRKTFSDNVLIRVRLSGGAEGWGEASSSLAAPEQTGPRMLQALARLGRFFRGRDVRDLEGVASASRRAEPGAPAAVGALECALTDAFCRAEGLPFFALFGGARRDLKTLMSVSAVGPAQVTEIVAEGRRRGFDVFKLKVNGREPLLLNLDRTRAARRAAPRGRFLLDPNQSFAPAGLEEFLDVLREDGFPLVLVEEPFPKGDWAALRRYPRKFGVPVILDESAQSAADARKIARDRSAEGVNVKVAKSGLYGGLEIAAALASLPARPIFMIGCMAESKVGLAAAAQFAMGLGFFDYADLDSDLLLKPLDISGGYVRRGPWLSLPGKPAFGLGVSP